MSALLCEFCKCTAEEAAAKRGGWLVATEHEHHDDVALCVSCIRPYSLLETDHLEHVAHTLLALLQQALVDELEKSAPLTMHRIADAVAAVCVAISSNAWKLYLYAEQKERT